MTRHVFTGKSYVPNTLMNECCWAAIQLVLAEGPATLDVLQAFMPRANKGNFPKYLKRMEIIQPIKG